MRLSAIALVVAAAAIVPGAASAQTALTDRAAGLEFLAGFEGTWVGRGNSRGDTDKPFEITRCEINSSFDVSTGALTNAGPCANLQGSTTFSGTMTLAEGGELVGSFFSRVRGIEMVSSEGQLFDDRISIDQHYRARIDGVLDDIYIRVTVGKPAEGGWRMIAEALDDATNQYVEVSNIVFTRN